MEGIALKILEKETENIDSAHYVLGRYYRLMENFGKAKKHLEAQNPSQWTIGEWILLYCDMGEYSKAITCWEENKG